jgi:acetoin utilization protein AcuC
LRGSRSASRGSKVGDILSRSVGLVRVEDIARTYDFGASHPLRPERVLLTYENIDRLGLSRRDHVEALASRSATDDEVLAVHGAEFVDAVKSIDAGERTSALEFGLGTPDDPIFPNMHKAAAAVCGASIVAAEAVASGDFEHAFNPAGGLHHARRREASGFCIYNDPAAAIARVLAIQPGWRVMYVDVDVHHGDGVQWIFYDDPRVLTVSFHQSGRYLYPGTGSEDEIGEGSALGTAANVPLLPYTGNDDYLWALERVMTDLSKAFRPHLIVTQLGADTHHGDPLAELGLTMAAYPRMAEILHETAHEFCDGRWVATGGGGYQAETVVPKVWTIHFAEMCDAPEVIPHDWLEDHDPSAVSQQYREHVERSVERVLETCVPRLASLVG